jgi:hypothetical protein
MNNQSNELTKGLAQAITRRTPLKKLGLAVANSALACCALAGVSFAQTSVVCDPAGDTTYAGAKGGPKIPAWLDIVQTEVTDTGNDIHFTLTLNAAIPASPA